MLTDDADREHYVSEYFSRTLYCQRVISITLFDRFIALQSTPIFQSLFEVEALQKTN